MGPNDGSVRISSRRITRSRAWPHYMASSTVRGNVSLFTWHNPPDQYLMDRCWPFWYWVILQIFCKSVQSCISCNTYMHSISHNTRLADHYYTLALLTFSHAFINSTKEVVLAVLDHYYIKANPLPMLVPFLCRRLQKIPTKLNYNLNEHLTVWYYPGSHRDN